MLTERVQEITREYIMPAVVDGVFNENTFARMILSEAKKWRGREMKFPITTEEMVGGTSFSGFDSLPTASSNVIRSLAFDPKFYQIHISLPLTELSVNEGSTEEQVLGLAETYTKLATIQMADELGDIFYSDGTGNGAKDFDGLGNMVDDGTDTTTYGKLDRATYGANINAQVLPSGGTLTLGLMRTLYNLVDDGPVSPTDVLTTKTIFGFYESLLQPQERYNKPTGDIANFKMGTGARELQYLDMPIKADRKATAETMFMLNMPNINFHGLPFRGASPIQVSPGDIVDSQYDKAEGLGFSWSGWMSITDQAAIIGRIFLGGQLSCDNPRRNGKLTGVTTV